MARPEKQGLDYFPFPVDFFDNEIIDGISGAYGKDGEIVAIKLLCAIYRKGYYLEWNDLTQSQLSKKVQISKEDVIAIVNKLIEWGYFDKTLYESYKILTSEDIQDTFFIATKRRKKMGKLPFLVNAYNNDGSEGVNVYNNPTSSVVNDDISTQSKVNQSKVKKSKLDIKMSPVTQNSADFQATGKDIAVNPDRTSERSNDDYFKSVIDLYKRKIYYNPNLKDVDILEKKVNRLFDGGMSYLEATNIVKTAINVSAKYQAKNINYIATILDNWDKKELYSLSDVEDYIMPKNKDKPKFEHIHFDEKNAPF